MALQLDDTLIGPLLELLVLIESLLGLFVERLQVRDVRQFVLEVRESIVEMRDEHAELSAPVADVIDTQHVESNGLEQSADGVSDDGGSEVTDVHFFGDVWRGEVDEDTLLGDTWQSDSGGSQRRDLLADVVGVKEHVDVSVRNHLDTID